MCFAKFFLLICTVSFAGAAKDNTEWKIILGEPAHERAYPFFAELLVEVDGVGNVICGAVQISKRDFLTAAHCVYFSRSRHDGFERILPNVNIYSRNGVFVKTYISYVHEAYTNYVTCPHDNDIAILRTFEDVPGKFAQLPPYTEFKDTLPRDGRLVAIGHGKTEHGTLSNQLLQTNISTPQPCKIPSCSLGADFCAFPYNISKCLSVEVDGNLNMKCQDTCQGDSGGPLFLPANTTDDVIVIGLTSRGYGCGKLDSESLKPLPGIYTNVGLHLEWIKETTRPGGKIDMMQNELRTSGSARLVILFSLLAFVLLQ